MSNPIIIIGSGLAGYMLAKEFRQLNTDLSLMIITANDGRFYSKPLLSTAFTSKRDIATLTTATAETMSKQLNATILTHTKILKINANEKTIVTETNNVIAYSKLVIATGSAVIKPALLGNATDAIISVNDLEDYARFRELLNHKRHIAILGAGLVGCEFANDLINNGYHIDVIDPAFFPLQRLIPEAIAKILIQAFAEEGVQWHLGEAVKEVNYKNDRLNLTLSSDQILETEIVLSAIGLRPNITIAEQVVKTNYGILVDRNLETSCKDIYALGDCAEVNGLVLFFVLPLVTSARALAKTLAGQETSVIYPAMPVTIKTPLCPLVVSPPPKNIVGEWQVIGSGKDLKTLFYDQDHHLRGFALSGKMVIEKAQLLKELPPLF